MFIEPTLKITIDSSQVPKPIFYNSLGIQLENNNLLSTQKKKKSNI